MELENQVTTLEQSKRIEELEIEIESYWWWYKWGGEFYLIDFTGLEKHHEMYPAPTVEEIAELLPRNDDMHFDVLFLGNYTVNCWERINKKSSRAQSIFACQGETLTQALASMLIWLIENNHIKTKE